MKVLIVATNNTAPDLLAKIAEGKHQRVDYIELARSLSTHYIDYEITPPKSPIRWLERKVRMDYRLARRVSQIVRDERYDVVLSLSERVGLPLTRLLERHVKHVVIMHHPMSANKLRLMRILDVANRWDHIITISYAEGAALQEALNLPEGFIIPILTPIDTQFFKPFEDGIPMERQDHIQSLGLSHRDFPTLINAMRMLPDIQCHLRVGSAWVDHKAGHEDEVLPHNIQIKPYVSPDALRAAYAYSRFIVVPIRGDTQWSAGCTSVQIGQAMGKAVIASDRPGLSNYLIDGETGILVRTGDIQDMAEAIDYLWRNPAKADQMGRRGREWHEANYAMESWIENVTAALKFITPMPM
ncbi:MAG: glycosyltransferase family 4 protein [Anaerolineae bacterium]